MDSGQKSSQNANPTTVVDSLQTDLGNILNGHDLSFDGAFHYAGLLPPTSPNPCLQISGLGTVGLPLSERDAKALTSSGKLTPVKYTLANKKTRITWEVDADQVSFGNPGWGKYVEDVVCVQACKALGVKLGDAKPRMTLHKLLLYEKGSHFSPQLNAQKASGMFATAVIILPTEFTGGHAHFSHSSSRNSVDCSKQSLFSTALLAWYGGVKHEIGEITSGHRLALSYSLIHAPSPSAPLPILPDTSGLLRSLRNVLQRWRDGKYGNIQDRVVAYPLQQEYSTDSLKSGSKALKGVDANRLTFFRSAAEELGFVLGLAVLSHEASGDGDDSGCRYRRRHHYYDYDFYDSDPGDDYDEEVPDMVSIESVSTSIENIVDLNGSPLLPRGIIRLDENCLIPKDAFKNKTPDEQDYDGYMGGYAGQVHHHYRRTAVIMVQASQMDSVYYKAGGASYALERLRKSNKIPPTDEDRLWASRSLQGSSSLSQPQVLTLMEYALKWKDLNMWKEVIKCPSCTLKDTDKALFLKAWQVFSFEKVCLSLEELLARSTNLGERITFIYTLLSQSTKKDRSTVQAWCQKESGKILSSYNSAYAQDIPNILIVIRFAGLDAFSKMMLPNLLKKENAFSFLLALRKALVDGRQSILEQQAFSQAPELLNSIIKSCLAAAALQWSDPSSQYLYSWAGSKSPSVDRIVQIVEEATSSNNPQVVTTLFDNVLNASGDMTNRFTQIYTPLIASLKASLSKSKSDIHTRPFVDFVQRLVGLYLRDVLGKKGPKPNLRKIGCGCEDCARLDQFIMNPRETTTTIQLAQKRRTHVETRAAKAADLCTYTTVKDCRPHGVKLTKLPEVVSAIMWDQKEQTARKFLQSVGSDADIARIMGSRYLEVAAALQGTQAFAFEVTPITSSMHSSASAAPPHATPTTVQLAATSSSSINTLSVNAPAAASKRVAGAKRKGGPGA